MLLLDISILLACHAIQHTTWATAFRQADLFFPLVEGAHILSLSVSVGLILMLDFRLLGLGFQSEPVWRIMDQIMPWAIPGFTMMFLTGILLFLAQAESVYTNSYFRVKMLMLLLLGVNAVVFQFKYYPSLAEWDKVEAVPTGARVVAVVSLAFWMVVIACGRLMAYEL